MEVTIGRGEIWTMRGINTLRTGMMDSIAMSRMVEVTGAAEAEEVGAAPEDHVKIDRSRCRNNHSPCQLIGDQELGTWILFGLLRRL